MTNNFLDKILPLLFCYFYFR